MKVLVIGSKGFIGSYVASHFATCYNHEVYECDVVVDYERPNYHIIDATNADYHTLFQKIRFDACINCSGASSVPDSLIHPLRDYTLNTYNVFKILDAIRLYQPDCKFINMSSAAVYGNPQQLPIKEGLPLSPISPYGIHKKHAETIGEEFYSIYNIPNCSLRIFSAYGAGLKKQLFWDVFQKGRKSDRVELFGTGMESRDFIYVDDIVSAIHCCLMNAKFNGEAINIASGKETTISQAVHTFFDMFPKKKEVVFNGKVKEGDPLYWKADVSALQFMGYKPSINLPGGLEKYFTWVNQL
jgi:UDP-glucose 4-epimerase